MSLLRLVLALLMVMAADAGPALAGPETKFDPIVQRLMAAYNAGEAGDAKAFGQDFAQVMTEAFPPAKAATVLQQLRGQFGRFLSFGAPKFPAPDAAVYPGKFERGELDIKLHLDARGQVDGLFFAQPEPDEVAPEANRVPLALPFKGRWLVFWGGDTAEQNYHVNHPDQRRAFDLLGVDAQGKTHVGDGTRNEDYACFGRELFAPADGVVLEAVDGVRDNVPGQMNPLSAIGNGVTLELGPQEYAVLAHMQQGSVRVKAGDKVRRGQVLGLCGNSGNSSEPHLHFHLQHRPVHHRTLGIKAFFEQVMVERRGGKPTLEKRYSPVKGDIISPP